MVSAKPWHHNAEAVSRPRAQSVQFEPLERRCLAAGGQGSVHIFQKKDALDGISNNTVAKPDEPLQTFRTLKSQPPFVDLMVSSPQAGQDGETQIIQDAEKNHRVQPPKQTDSNTSSETPDSEFLRSLPQLESQDSEKSYGSYIDKLGSPDFGITRLGHSRAGSEIAKALKQLFRNHSSSSASTIPAPTKNVALEASGPSGAVTRHGQKSEWGQDLDATPAYSLHVEDISARTDGNSHEAPAVDEPRPSMTVSEFANQLRDRRCVSTTSSYYPSEGIRSDVSLASRSAVYGHVTSDVLMSVPVVHYVNLPIPSLDPGDVILPFLDGAEQNPHNGSEDGGETSTPKARGSESDGLLFDDCSYIVADGRGHINDARFIKQEITFGQQQHKSNRSDSVEAAESPLPEKVSPTLATSRLLRTSGYPDKGVHVIVEDRWVEVGNHNRPVSDSMIPKRTSSRWRPKASICHQFQSDDKQPGLTKGVKRRHSVRSFRSLRSFLSVASMAPSTMSAPEMGTIDEESDLSPSAGKHWRVRLRIESRKIMTVAHKRLGSILRRWRGGEGTTGKVRGPSASTSRKSRKERKPRRKENSAQLHGSAA